MDDAVHHRTAMTLTIENTKCWGRTAGHWIYALHHNHLYLEGLKEGPIKLDLSQGSSRSPQGSGGFHSLVLSDTVAMLWDVNMYGLWGKDEEEGWRANIGGHKAQWQHTDEDAQREQAGIGVNHLHWQVFVSSLSNSVRGQDRRNCSNVTNICHHSCLAEMLRTSKLHLKLWRKWGN